MLKILKSTGLLSACAFILISLSGCTNFFSILFGSSSNTVTSDYSSEQIKEPIPSISKARAGDAQSQFDTGVAYELGLSVPKDEIRAAMWFRMAAIQGHPMAQFNLGRMAREGIAGASNIKAAREWFEKSANQGFVPAQNILGELNLSGEGSARDIAKSAEWYKLSATQNGLPTGIAKKLGRLFLYGDGVPTNLVEADYWFTLAIENNVEIDSADSRILGLAFTDANSQNTDEKKALFWLRNAANLGDFDDWLDFGQRLLVGDGVPIDKKEAIVWYRKSHETKPFSVNECLSIADALLEGEVDDSDKTESVFWRTQAAGQDDPSAQTSLAKILLTNDYGPRDSIKAKYWLEKAVANNEAEAMYRLGILFLEGDGVDKSAKIAVHWFRKASEMGHPRAQYELAKQYYSGFKENSGKQITRSYELAYMWADMATINGVEEANALRWYSELELPQFKRPVVRKLSKECLRSKFVNCYQPHHRVHSPPSEFNDDNVKAVSQVGYGSVRRDLQEKSSSGDPNASLRLGMIFEQGLGIKSDLEKAYYFYNLAAEAGLYKGQYRLANLLSKESFSGFDEEEAFEWFEEASSQGDLESNYRAGMMILNGQGVDEDDEEAGRRLRFGAEKGHAASQLILGKLYSEGRGVVQDDVMASVWWKRGAENGNSESAFFLGKAYLSGIGIPINEENAKIWLQHSARQGFGPAQELLNNN